MCTLAACLAELGLYYPMIHNTIRSTTECVGDTILLATGTPFKRLQYLLRVPLMEDAIINPCRWTTVANSNHKRLEEVSKGPC